MSTHTDIKETILNLIKTHPTESSVRNMLSRFEKSIREEERERTHTDTFHAKGSGQCSCVYNSRGDQVGMCLRCSELTDKAYKKGYTEGGKDAYSVIKAGSDLNREIKKFNSLTEK